MEDLFNGNFSPFSLSFAGPFKVNGVPLRRVNQAYVIATSTKVDVSSVDVAKYADAYFKREVTKKGESEFFEAEKEVGVSLFNYLGHDLI